MNRCPYCSSDDSDWVEQDDTDDIYRCWNCGMEHYRRRIWHDVDDDQAPATVPAPPR